MLPQFVPRVLPQGLEALTELALDLRWTWSHVGDALWRNIDPDLWERTRSPWAILQYTPHSRLEALLENGVFRDELRDLAAERERYANEPGYHAQSCRDAGLGCIAYFSMEFGLSEAFPLYAGGLGILAGDCLKTASDLGLPLVGVGLLYQEGYFRQMVDARGRQREAYPYNDPSTLPIQPVLGASGAWLRIALEFPGRTVHLRVWQASVGRVRLYLLDSNDLLNGPGDRGITAKLYGGGAEMRLMQEAVLGIGGWRMLETLGLEPEVCHLNEGHAAFAVLERAARFARRSGVSFEEALWATRAGNVFTTHTPVAAGFDRFAPELMQQYFHDALRPRELSLAALLALGRADPGDDREAFNMAYLALRGCGRANGVSRLHGEVSRRLFSGLYPRWPEREVPIDHVTNGVHVPSWDSPWSDRLWSQACGKRRWLGALDALAGPIQAIDDEMLWVLASQERLDLVQYARERLAWQLGQRGAPPERIADAAHALDANVLTLGFARRFAEYKRPNLLLRDPDRLARLLLDRRRPVQLIVAGKAHPEDEEGKRLVQAWLEFVNRPDVRARAVFLEDYDMALAQELVQGVDVWINTPRRPWEACGTSGMKVLANGGLNVSTLDGWWAEAYAPEVGWAIGDDVDGSPEGDAADAERLYRALEREVVPLFYERDARGVPRAWVRRMRASIASLAPAFSSTRMLQEYLERLYLPAATAFRRRAARGAELAQALRRWHAALVAGWHEIHFGEVRAEREGEAWRIEVPVHLGEISPEQVAVELYADGAPGAAPVRAAMRRGEPLRGAVHGFLYAARVPASRPLSDYTARVRAWHPEALTPNECALVQWQR
jgi:starch phosphorylase